MRLDHRSPPGSTATSRVTEPIEPIGTNELTSVVAWWGQLSPLEKKYRIFKARYYMRWRIPVVLALLAGVVVWLSLAIHLEQNPWMLACGVALGLAAGVVFLLELERRR